MKKTSKSLNTIKVELDLPDDFIKACEFCNINRQVALETYLNHITFYNFLFDEEEEPNAKATRLFKKNNSDQFTLETIQVAKHSQLHVAPIKEIIAVGMQKLGSSSFEYLNIIKKWHMTIPNN